MRHAQAASAGEVEQRDDRPLGVVGHDLVALVDRAAGGRAVEPAELVGRHTVAQVEAHGRLGAELGDQRARHVERHHAAAVHHRDTVAEPLGLLHVVRGEHDRGAVAVDLADHLPERPPGARVEAGGGLVEEGHDRVVDQRQGDREPLRLPPGELVDEGLGLVAQTDAGEQRRAVVAAAVDAVARAEDVDDLVQTLIVEQARWPEAARRCAA